MAKKGKIRKNVVRGIAHIKATQNNTLVTITDMNGETVAWDSAGTIGFKGARKSTPFAASRASEKAASTQPIQVKITVMSTFPGRPPFSASY